MPGCFGINSKLMRYFVNPHSDTNINDNSIKTDMAELDLKQSNQTIMGCTKYFERFTLDSTNQIAPYWIGLKGDSSTGYVPSKEEVFTMLMEGAQGLLAYVSENLSSYLPVSMLLNLFIQSKNY